jgi:hypothetical protein
MSDCTGFHTVQSAGCNGMDKRDFEASPQNHIFLRADLSATFAAEFGEVRLPASPLVQQQLGLRFHSVLRGMGAALILVLGQTNYSADQTAAIEAHASVGSVEGRAGLHTKTLPCQSIPLVFPTTDLEDSFERSAAGPTPHRRSVVQQPRSADSYTRFPASERDSGISATICAGGSCNRLPHAQIGDVLTPMSLQPLRRCLPLRLGAPQERGLPAP